jgi:hypothetical protein
MREEGRKQIEDYSDKKNSDEEHNSFLTFYRTFAVYSPASFAQEPLSYVDPNIGGVGLILEPTRPTVQLPNQMIRSYPGRKDYLDAPGLYDRESGI